MPPALQFLVLTFAGWVNRHQDDLIEYLREENLVLREYLGPRPLRLTDAQRRRLAVRGHKLGRRVLRQVAGIVSVSNSSSGRRWKLDHAPAVGDPTHMVEFGTGRRAFAREA